MYLILEDDIHRTMLEISKHMMNDIYLSGEWYIVRTYKEFKDYITDNGLPELISLDHDLAFENYETFDYNSFTAETGVDAAKFLVQYCLDNNCKLPKILVHSYNPLGKMNIESVILTAKKYLNL